MARDSRFSKIDVDELAAPHCDDSGNLELYPVSFDASQKVWMAFETPFVVGSYLEGHRGEPIRLTICDFASAGNTWTPASRYRVWLPQLLDPSKESRY
jgi:hypothetical protein